MLLITVISLLSLGIGSQCMNRIEREWKERLVLRRHITKEHEVKSNAQSEDVKITALVSKVVGEVERVEALRAVIVNPLPKKGLPRGSSGDFTESDREYMRQSLGAVPIDQSTKIGDEAGHILGYALGGPAHRRNLFPQHSGSNRNLKERHTLSDWVMFERALRDYMSKNQRGKIEYWVLFHFPSEIFNLGRDRPQRYYLNRPTKFDFYAKLYNDNNVAEYECVGEMSNSKDGFSASSANAVGARTTRRTTTTTTTTIRPEQTVESSPEITVEELVAARKCVTLVRELIPNPFG